MPRGVAGTYNPALARAKGPTEVDADGLRLFCPQGHRLYWPEAVRERRRRPKEFGAPPIYASAERAICSAGEFWDQKAQPMRQRRWDAAVQYIPTDKPPRLEHSRYSRLTSDHHSPRLIVEITAQAHRFVRVEFACSRYSFYDEHDNDEEPVQHKTFDTSDIHDESTWLSALVRARNEGWDLTGSAKCSVCLYNIARYHAWVAAERQKALALERP